MSIEFSMDVRREGDVTILYPAGYVDFEAKDLMVPAFKKVLDDGAKRIVMNFADVKRINSMGISVILELIDEANERKAEVKYANLSRMNTKLFKMVGLTDYGSMHDSEEEALAAF